MAPKSKEAALNIARLKAREYMTKCGSWSQSTVLALQDTFGLKDENILKAASGLTGGIGGMHDACGSLLGASLIFGVVFGRGYDGLADRDKLTESMTAAGKLYKWYEKEFGSATCRDICTRFGGGVYYDRHVPWQAEMAKAAGITEKCNELAQKTAAKAAEMIWDGLHKGKWRQAMVKEPDIESTRQEARAAKLRKKRLKMKQHGKGLGKIYKDVVEKRGKW